MLRVLGIYKNAQIFRENQINDILGESSDKWYFIDYCDTDYKLGHKFETGEILENIQLNFPGKRIMTNFTASLCNIQSGYKHICKISNLDDSRLNYLTEHKYVENPIELK